VAQQKGRLSRPFCFINAAGKAGRSEGLSPHGDSPCQRRAACCRYGYNPLRGESLKDPRNGETP